MSGRGKYPENMSGEIRLGGNVEMQMIPMKYNYAVLSVTVERSRILPQYSTVVITVVRVMIAVYRK